MSVPIWVNGELYEPDKAVVSVYDHGLMVGDGVFETVKAVNGESFALTRHLDRLALSAKRMDLPEPDLAAIADGVRRCLAAAPKWPLARIRITYTSGPGPLGSDRGSAGTNAIAIVGEQAPFPATADVVVVPWPRNERGALSGVKSTSYGDNAKALAYAKERGGAEAIFENLAGNLCEGTGSNIFIVTGGRLITPTLSSGCLAGVTRALTLEWCGGEEADVPISALYEAEEAFLTSTTRDIQPIRAVDGKVLPQAPGPVTLEAMKVFAERSAADLDP
ncbi:MULTISPECIES: aminotransferase class IV [Microbispora]|jgi:branched-chain amino acid aminotransferase|uniref:4-amino-4-deoxychorismate lyase n=1 Tax=Microbispora catharanthi TaxID=1712871 RepID=A0A5N6BW49_9ACTN|nr:MULTISPECIES: aminotransferase class IV [Microbispora]KAB8184540.1 4-amino-4-deoxychorismate lyase [Microbispora catharanthi]TQS25562.1 4-amino-4-deoxychorismate lyase [Microbispora sp. KK1-11]GLX09282.1 4-amino-4-deoxychorismate lyase [Microbispora sp. NBRC 16548]